MTIEPQPAGPTFARSARVNGTCTTYERIYIYIYIKNIYIYMTKIFPHCTISVGLAPLADYDVMVNGLNSVACYHKSRYAETSYRVKGRCRNALTQAVMSNFDQSGYLARSL